MYKGILAIGDPHITACKPGRRTDEDFLETSLDKLRQGLDIAKVNRLLPIITGDLVDVEYERKVIVPLIETLVGHNVIVLGGNHDKKQRKVKGDTTLSILRASKVCTIVDKPGHHADVEIDGKLVSIYMVPHGYEIPDDITDSCKGEKSIMITHADLDLDGSFKFPGMVKPFPIKGCDMVINGHLHLFQSPLETGGTLWTNPGNILRMSIDTMDHEPAVFEWTPSKQGLKKHPLEYIKNVFDTNGYIPSKSKKIVQRDMASKFAEMLKKQSLFDRAQTDNGDLIEEELDNMFKESEYSEATEVVVRELKIAAVESYKESIAI